MAAMRRRASNTVVSPALPEADLVSVGAVTLSKRKTNTRLKVQNAVSLLMAGFLCLTG
jgi:hypothetical protein